MTRNTAVQYGPLPKSMGWTDGKIWTFLRRTVDLQYFTPSAVMLSFAMNLFGIHLRIPDHNTFHFISSALPKKSSVGKSQSVIASHHFQRSEDREKYPKERMGPLTHTTVPLLS
jgi:hypothetical protein